MKKFIAVIIVSVIIGGTGHLDELVKLPFLIQHYSEHKAQHPDDSVLAFLYKHYVLNQKAESEKDKKSDSEMPFKSSQTFHSYFMPFVFVSNTYQMVCNSTTNIFIPFQEIKNSSGFFDVWYPPKVG